MRHEWVVTDTDITTLDYTKSRTTVGAIVFARPVIFFTVAALAMSSQRLSGQIDPSDCPHTTAALAPGNRDAVWNLTRCPESGPRTLAATWTRPGMAGSDAGPTLVEVSGLLRDARVFRAVRSVATSADRPVADRLAALQVLVRHFNPNYARSSEFLLSAAPGSPIPTQLDGPSAVDGAAPLPADARSQVGRVLAALAISDPDATVRGAARRLRQSLMYLDPAHTPLAAGTVALVAECSARVTLRSTADIDAEVQLRVVGSQFSKTYGVRAGTAAQPSNLLLSLPKGVVVASYGGNEIARLTKRDAPCLPSQLRW